VKRVRYCPTCRANTCPTCKARGGRHQGICTGRHRTAPAVRGVVSEQALLDVYRGTWANAVRVAATICGPLLAEDAVQEAAAYLSRRRQTLAGISVGFFITVVAQRAHHIRLSAWRRHARALGPEGLAAVQRRRERRILAGT
jgi:hypothetical protein